jgi:putative DNA primase/helicase
VTLSEFLLKLDQPALSGGQYVAKCPAHDDGRPSLGVRAGDRAILLQCYAGCSPEAIVSAMGLQMSDLFYEPASRHGRNGSNGFGYEVEAYPYRDENGTELFQSVRYADPKDFRPRHRDKNTGAWIYSLKDVRRVVYRLNELQRKDGAVFAEGEKDCNRLWDLGIPATCNIGGASKSTKHSKWLEDYTTQLVNAGVKRFRVIPDNDEPGRAHASHIVRSCRAAGIDAGFVVLPVGKDASDYLDAGHTKEDLVALLKNPLSELPAVAVGESSTVASVEVAEPAGPVLVTMNTVKPQPVSWLWTYRLARGKVTLIIGDPGKGKSFLTLDMAARLSTGRDWPDGQPNVEPPSDAVFLAAEDGLADTMLPRLDAMGADTSRIHILLGVRDRVGENERGFNFQTDLQELRAVIVEKKATLVVVDPVSNYLGNTDAYRDTEVRQVLMPLVGLAASTGVAVVLVMHLTKDTKASALYRANGSVAFGGIARIVMAVGPDPDEPNPHLIGSLRVLATVKTNFRPAVPWSYRLTDDNKVEWVGARDDINPESLFGGSASRSGDDNAGDAEAFIIETLADGRNMAVKDLEARASEEGIKKNRLYRARQKLCDASKVGFGADGQWSVRLKVEYRAEATGTDTAGGPNSAKGCTPPSLAILGGNEPVSPLKTLPFPKITGIAALGAALGRDDERF